MTPLENRQEQYLDGLLALHGFLRDRPALCPAHGGVSIYVWADNAEELAALTRALGSGDKRASGDSLAVDRRFGPHTLTVIASRGDTCTKREVGTEVVEVLIEREDVLDTDTVLPPIYQPTQVKVRRVVPTYEWDCPPILSAVPDETEVQSA